MAREPEDDERWRGLYEEAQQALARAREAAERERLDTVARLAGGVAHDLNNHLTVIQGYAGLIRDASGDQTAFKRYAERIGQAAELTLLLVRQLMAVGGKAILEREPVDVEAFLVGLERTLAISLGSEVSLRLDLEPGLVVEADPDALATMLVALARNARAALPAGGAVTVEARRVELEAESPELGAGGEAGAYVRLAVRDDGLGMSEAVRARAFEPFFTTRPTGKGVGLGLSTVRGLAVQQGGWASLESLPDAGTTAAVHLPLSAAPVPTATSSLGGHETILVVDDDDLVREYTCGVLQALGYTALPAADADEALALLEGGRPCDLVLTDVVMPGTSGFALAELVAARRPGLPVIYTSGHPGDAKLGGGPSILLKPFGTQDLGRAVRRALDPPQED